MIAFRPLIFFAAVSAVVVAQASAASAQTIALALSEQSYSVVSAPPPAIEVRTRGWFASAPYPAVLSYWPDYRPILYYHPPEFAIYPINPIRVRTWRRPARRVVSACGCVARRHHWR
jgi:hypothetical protein